VSGSHKLGTWSASLRAIAIFNIALWIATCAPLVAAQGALRWQVALSGIYVAVCAFRSWLPRVDLERYCLHDSPLSSTFIGRSAATVAEVAFAAQIALLLHQLGTTTQLGWIVSFSYWVVPVLALAQCFCWYSVITLNHLGHAVEQSLWTVTMGIAGASVAAAAGHTTGSMKLLLWAVAGISAVFVTFMVTVDIPMYVRRYREGRRLGVRYLSFREGVRDAIERRIAVRDWNKWRPEVAWLTGYFSFAVWLSVALVHFTQP
jgi:hypothetical protein